MVYIPFIKHFPTYTVFDMSLVKSTRHLFILLQVKDNYVKDLSKIFLGLCLCDSVFLSNATKLNYVLGMTTISIRVCLLNEQDVGQGVTSPLCAHYTVCALECKRAAVMVPACRRHLCLGSSHICPKCLVCSVTNCGIQMNKSSSTHLSGGIHSCYQSD